MSDVYLLIGLLVFTGCCIAVAWAFNVFEWEVVWEAKQGRVTPIARWIRPHGMPDIDVFLEMDVDRIKLGD